MNDAICPECKQELVCNSAGRFYAHFCIKRRPAVDVAADLDGQSEDFGPITLKGEWLRPTARFTDKFGGNREADGPSFPWRNATTGLIRVIPGNVADEKTWYAVDLGQEAERNGTQTLDEVVREQFETDHPGEQPEDYDLVHLKDWWMKAMAIKGKVIFDCTYCFQKRSEPPRGEHAFRNYISTYKTVTKEELIAKIKKYGTPPVSQEKARQMGMSESVAEQVLSAATSMGGFSSMANLQPPNTEPAWTVGVTDTEPKCCYFDCNGVRLVRFRHADGALLELNITGADMSFEDLRALKEKISEIIYDKERQQ